MCNRMLKASVASALCIAVVATFGGPLKACDWDTETLLQERSRFPTTLEIILGKFPRHSDEYYQWRLEDRLQTLDQEGINELLLDDVAVSYEKLGRYEEAIEVATKQLDRNPQRYESLANLGTFLIHSGKLREGLTYIEKAIEVNPEAHFGREKYQVILVKYVLSRTTDDGLELPLATERFDEPRPQSGLPFYKFLLQNLDAQPKKNLSKEEVNEAMTGILGMMRFSRHDSPILLEVLGEMQQAQSARQLAYRAYMSAAYNVEDAKSKKRYKELASRVLDLSRESWKSANGVEVTEAEIADDFRAERDEANSWYASVAADEKNWISQGVAVDERFNEKYREIPEAITTDPVTQRDSENNSATTQPNLAADPIAICVLLVFAIVATFVVYWLRLRHQSLSTVQE